MLFSRAFIKSSFLTINPCRKFQILNILNHYLGFTEGNISPSRRFRTLRQFEHAAQISITWSYLEGSVCFLVCFVLDLSKWKAHYWRNWKKKQQWEINKSLLTQIQSFLIRLKNKNNKISATNTDYKENLLQYLVHFRHKIISLIEQSSNRFQTKQNL